MRLLLLVCALIGCFQFSSAQLNKLNNSSQSNSLDYAKPKQYEIAGIVVSGIEYLDVNAIKSLSGLVIGDRIKIPGEDITAAINNLWKQGLFDNVSIEISKIQGELIFLDLKLSERPRLVRFRFEGVKKSTADDLREKINLVRGKIVNDNLLNNTERLVIKHFVDKGYYNAEVELIIIDDKVKPNSVEMVIKVDKKEKTKIENITITGNTHFTDKKVKHFLKETKEVNKFRIFKVSKYLDKNLEEDIAKLIAKYNDDGYRDAQVIKDSIYKVSEDRINLDIEIREGNPYYFGKIIWTGNSKYKDKALSNILGIDKGEIYNKALLDKRLSIDPAGRDVSSLYLDDGYLFFQITPIEKRIYNDTIDLEIRIYEGAQATIDRIIVKGNEKTNDKVVYREIRTKPGQKFSRSDIIRTTRELVQLGYFDPERLGVNPIPHPETGTVDIEYTLAEKPSDQIELSGGFGGGRIIGTLGLSLNNYSIQNTFKKGAWNPVPSGDGQRLSIRAQTDGLQYRSYSFSFTEPWLGGKKPNSFTFSIFDSKTSTNRSFLTSIFDTESFIRISGVSVSLGKRLKKPDDFFTLVNSLNFQKYTVKASPVFTFSDGISYNVNLRSVLSRNSVDAPIYPRRGSTMSLSVEVTPPYSLLNNKDYSDLPTSELYKFIEYHKWKFDNTWYNNIVGNLVLKTSLQYGFLGFYSSDIGFSPFERFVLGGDGLSGFSGLDGIQGSEIIGLRGYANRSVAQTDEARDNGSPFYSKYSLELRQPLTLNPSATIFVLAFADAGNTWNSFSQFNPFSVKRSAGFGARIFLPIFGLLGVDYGWRFDEIPGFNDSAKGRFAFTIGQQF
ncbi:MAG: outer membrane protein insertion porin family [Sphingobacteriales bacterium]|jgi:outer membrane protein insertion porin family